MKKIFNEYCFSSSSLKPHQTCHGLYTVLYKPTNPVNMIVSKVQFLEVLKCVQTLEDT